MHKQSSFSELHWAILKTIAYADIFDYPVTLPEIHRYLIDTEASLSEVEATLHSLVAETHTLWICEPYYGLAGHEHTFAIRQQRSQHAQSLWHVAARYGQWISRLPFVRMVAVTGSLAVDNVPKTGDIDYLVVTAPNRLWLARLLIIGLVRVAKTRGVTLCPNYLISENALHFDQQNLYTAREIVQMIPLSHLDTYQQLREVNRWADDYFPNAETAPANAIAEDRQSFSRRGWQLLEWVLSTPVGAWIDDWEMRRKMRKLQAGDNLAEAQFSKDWCKGHFEGHQQRILNAYRTRLDTLAARIEVAEVL
jgi:hypothetical protein